MRQKGHKVEMSVLLSQETAAEVRRISEKLQLPVSRVVSLLVEDGLGSLTSKGGRKLAQLSLRVKESLEVVQRGVKVEA